MSSYCIYDIILYINNHNIMWGWISTNRFVAVMYCCKTLKLIKGTSHIVQRKPLKQFIKGSDSKDQHVYGNWFSLAG